MLSYNQPKFPSIDYKIHNKHNFSLQKITKIIKNFVFSEFLQCLENIYFSHNLIF